MLTSIPICYLMSLNIPKWVIQAIDKLRRAFMWKGRAQVNDGHCPITWSWITQPLELGGLGIHNLDTRGWASQMRWLWLRKTQPNRPWAAFDT
ncbi:hypothetical protein PR202_gb12774 [Eleusine coracana subsp. coracana]|uniref:Uncharacterized protein n=1 Tax=Eleusine coracana subsp. coracana TaxID=191504 RepID=A0AAV5EQG1_ELECO|nr:hypothetical protein PR202_gb12774 [Eleusine coracana subsp. coracana]